MAKNSIKGKKDSDVTMTEKVVIEGNSEERSIWSVFFGMVMLFLGIILVVVAIASIVLFRLPPKLDRGIDTPQLTALPEATSAREIAIRGSVDEDVKRVMIFVNGEVADSTVWVDNGNFKYEYELPKEGEYKIEAASVQGFPIRKRSSKSSPVLLTADWTAPSKDANVKYTAKVDTKETTVTGKVEPNATVVFMQGDVKYVTKADKDGNYSVTLPVKEGENKFTMEIKDLAGNTTTADTTVSVTRVIGQVNGNGQQTGGNGGEDLPESAGELEAAMAYLAGNKIMTTFGILALFALILNSGLVALKLRKESI